MLLNGALWAPALARVLDQSLRYTVDKTTREILFLPLPADIKLKAKSFVDVTVDRFAKALGALLLLVLVKPWGLHLDWQHLSYASLAVTALWICMSLRARRGYLTAFRQSIERARRRAGRRAAERRRSLDHRDAGAGARRSPIRRAWSTPSTCSSRSTSATWSRRCCSITSRRTCARGRFAPSARSGRDIALQLAAAGPAHARPIRTPASARRRSSRSARSTTRMRRRLSRPLLADPDPRIRRHRRRRAGGQPGAGRRRCRRGRAGRSRRRRPGPRRDARRRRRGRDPAHRRSRASGGC